MFPAPETPANCRDTKNHLTYGNGGIFMNTLVIVVIAACCLAAGYLLYGRWLIYINGALIQTPKHTTVTKKMAGLCSDRWLRSYLPRFSSIAGAGPVTGAIQAAVFGWVPVFLWIILGGIFFGAVTDFGALYASVKNEGKSMGLLIEQYIGKTGKSCYPCSAGFT